MEIRKNPHFSVRSCSLSSLTSYTDNSTLSCPQIITNPWPPIIISLYPFPFIKIASHWQFKEGISHGIVPRRLRNGGGGNPPTKRTITSNWPAKKWFQPIVNGIEQFCEWGYWTGQSGHLPTGPSNLLIPCLRLFAESGERKAYICSRTNMVKMVVVICWGGRTRCGFGPAGAEPPENPQFLQSLQDLVIFSGRERKREILLGGIQRCWFIGSAPIETVSKDSCKQPPTSTARLHFWHIKYFIWTNRLWEDYMYSESFVRWSIP